MGDNAMNMTGFGRVGFEEFETGRDIVKQIFNRDDGSRRRAGRAQ